jgi:hypothetical protein
VEPPLPELQKRAPVTADAVVAVEAFVGALIALGQRGS